MEEQDEDMEAMMERLQTSGYKIVHLTGGSDFTERKKQALVQALHMYLEATGIKLEFDEVWGVLQIRHLLPDPEEIS
jgi:hypothetical protein